MKFKWLKLCLVCLISVICMAGCGEKSQLKDELQDIELTYSLPDVSVSDCYYLSEADDAVYEQQIAACDMYYEAYYLTRTADYELKYKGDIKPERVAFYCNQRRSELSADITQQLRNNVREIIQSVEDCDNIEAYLDRVVYDAKNFYDYYADFAYAETNDEFVENACQLLKVFYERSNILAFSFMERYKGAFIEAATMRIVDNSNAPNTFSMYITENNEIIEALNSVYNGVDSARAEIISDATIRLVRNMLEDANELDEDSINELMYQLGEPTPEPTPESTVVPTDAPTQTPISTPPEVVHTPEPVKPSASVKTPTPQKTQSPAQTKQPEWWEFEL